MKPLLKPLIFCLVIMLGLFGGVVHAQDSKTPIRGEGLELVYFTATWCGPCKSMPAVVDELGEQGILMRPIDIDQFPQLASKYKVTQVPTILFLSDGQMVEKIVGVQPAAKLRDIFIKLRSRLPINPKPPVDDDDSGLDPFPHKRKYRFQHVRPSLFHPSHYQDQIFYTPASRSRSLGSGRWYDQAPTFGWGSD